jgi:hypothetical protein
MPGCDSHNSRIASNVLVTMGKPPVCMIIVIIFFHLSMQSAIWRSRHLCCAAIMPIVKYQDNWLIGLNTPGTVLTTGR